MIGVNDQCIPVNTSKGIKAPIKVGTNQGIDSFRKLAIEAMPVPTR